MKKAITMLAVVMLIAACGQKETAEKPKTTVDLLPKGIDSLNIVRSSEPKLFVGQDLYEHIDGGAEVYHLYDFVDVATAYYQRDTTEILADLYNFKTEDGAFGLFSTLRPEEPSPLPMGIEGFAGSGAITFVKGTYVVKLTGYDESVETTMLLREVGQAIESGLTGATVPPAAFRLFPPTDKIALSERIFAEAYLGQQSLTDVYTTSYLMDGDTMTFFLTEDKDGAKFTAWSEKMGGKKIDGVDEFALPFTEGKVVASDNSYYGVVVGGLKGSHLAGAVNYNQKHQQFFIDWLNSLP